MSFEYDIDVHVPNVFVRFAAGKGTALVIDVGQSVSSVIPVVDGFVLRKGLFWTCFWRIHDTIASKGVAYSNLPKLVHAHARHVLTGSNIDLTPHQLISSKIVSHYLYTYPLARA